MRIVVVLMILALPALAAEPATDAEKKPRLVVNELQALRVAPEEAAAITDAIATYLSGRGVFEILSTREIQTLLGAERQRQLLGACGDDSLSCGSDLSKLLSARFLLTGQLARVGSAYQLTLQLVDTERSQTGGRSSKLAGSLEEVRSLVPYAASEATGSPLPPPPSRVLPVTLLSLGGATLLSGGVVGLLALSRQAQLNDELCPDGVLPDGRCEGVNLRDREFYEAQDQSLVMQKIVSVSLMAAGAVMVGLGIWLLPPDDARTRISARIVPSLTGFAVVGGF
jgi:TolB-like protein